MANVVVTCSQLITGIPGEKRFFKRFIAIDQSKILKVGEGDGRVTLMMIQLSLL